MTVWEWLTVVGVCALGAVSPGPSLAVVVRQATVVGRGPGLACAWAHAAGVGVYAAATAAGLGVVIARQPRLALAISIAGAVYLAWLGVGALRAARAGGRVSPSGPRARRSAARQGFTVALLNPKIAVFFLALFSQFVPPGAVGAPHLLLAVTAVAVDGLWYSLVSMVLARPVWLAGYRRRAGAIEAVTGIVLLAVAAVSLARTLAY